MAKDLRAVIVIDYQNVHLTGHGLFTNDRPRHETLIDPLLFAGRLLQARNRAQRPGHPAAVLRRVLVYRGQPSNVHDPRAYARSQAQKAHWERDPRVEVTLRPLRYTLVRDAQGLPARGADGNTIAQGPPQEKGIDVLCALAVVREARNTATDLVILASTDSDLIPAIEEAATLGAAKIETCSWYNATRPRHQRGYELSKTKGLPRQWNTRLDPADFTQAADTTNYTNIIG